MSLPVEVIVGRKKVNALTQDLSARGMFIRMSPPLAEGAEMRIAISLEGQRHVTGAIVTHVLADSEARALGRYPGVGVAFREPIRASDTAFHEAIGRLVAEVTRHPPGELRIVVGDPETRLLERLSTALGNAGFAVMTATSGIEVVSACLTHVPDVVLLELDMPVVDGLKTLTELGRHRELAGVPVMIMSANAGDLARLAAVQRGAVDFIPKPFTVLEVTIRARRWARVFRNDQSRVALRGSLADLSLPTLLAMLEQEKKSGQLTVSRDEAVAWIDVLDGRILRVRSTDIFADSRAALFAALDWIDGHFELSSGMPLATNAELGGTVTHLLMEHARTRDEESR